MYTWYNATEAQRPTESEKTVVEIMKKRVFNKKFPCESFGDGVAKSIA